MKLRVKDLRKAHGMTVEALAEKAGMSKSYLSEIENGKKQINSRRLEALAHALGVSPLDLIDDASIDSGLLEHLHLLRRLSDADRAAVIRHAIVLSQGSEDE